MFNKKHAAILRLSRQVVIIAVVAIAFSLLLNSASLAEEGQLQTICQEGNFYHDSLVDAVNNLWVLVAGVLVLTMQLGFAMLEAGFSAAKNTVNVLFKNVADACLGILVYFAFGYALMYRPIEQCGVSVLEIGQFIGISPPYVFLNDLLPRYEAGHLSVYIDFFFQAAFVATATTICSGAVAGRIKPWAYLLLTFLVTGLVYPVIGYWVWGGGWLGGFHDFAGSLVVHAVGGSAALACILILKPRKGRFRDREKLSPREENDLFPHNLPLAALGTFILWMGWYGFNAGSALGIVGAEDRSPDFVGQIVLNTTIAACASALTVIVYRWFRDPERKIDLSTVLNGILGGLVGITASCDLLDPWQSIIVGIVAGLIVIGGVNLLSKLEIDDAVGAIPVHCFCGIWGGVAVWMFSIKYHTIIQLMGSFLIPAWSFTVVGSVFLVLNRMVKIRVSDHDERIGLDIPEHGEYAYSYLDEHKKQ